jgi:glycosyltransferase involved in cell wall biosynthesis
MRKRLEVSNNFVVGYHGRLSKEKNIKLLVDSFNAFKQSHPNAKLLVLGDGPEKKSLRGEDIISPGFVSDPERYLRAMDAYLFLSKTETSALALMEAIASGVPVVATNVGLVSTYVKDGKGILLKPADLKRHLVVKALDMIYNSPKAMKVMSKGALKEMNKKRSWYRVAKDLKKIFKETV